MGRTPVKSGCADGSGGRWRNCDAGIAQWRKTTYPAQLFVGMTNAKIQLHDASTMTLARGDGAFCRLRDDGVLTFLKTTWIPF
jgi:hypothetical protein